MKRLKTYIKEMAAMNVSEMDSEFLKRAQRVTSFNLRTADFESLDHKAEIQFLFKTHFFPDFNLDSTITRGITKDKANELIRALKSEDASAYNKLHFYNLKGVGPGEAALYFICDQAKLGGGTSAGVDLVIGSKQYEVKAAQYSSATSTVYGFKLGGTVPLGNMVTKAVELKERLGLKTSGKGQNEVNKTQIEAIKKEFPREWNAIERDYANKAHVYFGRTPVIFMNNNNTGGRLTRSGGGEIISVKVVDKPDIQIETITQGTIKPRVKV